MNTTGGLFCVIAIIIGAVGVFAPAIVSTPLYFASLGLFIAGTLYICSGAIRDAIEVSAERAAADAAQIKAALSAKPQT